MKTENGAGENARSADLHRSNTELLEQVQNGDTEAEARLVAENMGLVRTVARRFSDRGVEFEDLVQIGTIGMIRAIRSFCVERGNAFSTYAVPLIVGEIRRHLRDDGMIKVSRIYKQQGMQLMHEKNRILTEEGRDPGIAELAQRCGMTVEEASVALDAISPVTSLSEPVYGEDSVELGSTLTDVNEENEGDVLIDKIAIAQCVSRLPELWRKIVILRYYRDCTQQQTAELLSLTQVKVSREEKKILNFLREELT